MNLSVTYLDHIFDLSLLCLAILKYQRKMEEDAQPGVQCERYGDDASRCDDIVSKNNQNTMLLDRIFEAEIQNETNNMHSHKMIGFQGESRIFFFDCGQNRELQHAELENRKEKCRNLLLKVFVAPLVRIMRIGTTFFTVLDNVSYAWILLMYFGAIILNDMIEKVDILGIFDTDETTIHLITCAILGSDLIHNIMHSSTRLWNLSRIDLPLVLVIHSTYCILLSIGESTGSVYWYVFGFRFFSFYMTKSCEYWIDVWVQKTIFSLRQGNIIAGAEKNRGGTDFTLPMFNNCCSSVQKLAKNIGFPYSRLSSDDTEALSLYKGTFCSWNWRKTSVDFVKNYHPSECVQQLQSKWSHCVFYPGGFIAILTVLILSFVVAVFGLIAFFLGYLILLPFMCCRRCCDWGWEIYEELKLC